MTARAVRYGLAVDVLLAGVGVGTVVFGLEWGAWQPLLIGVVLLWLVSYDVREIRCALEAPGGPERPPDGSVSDLGTRSSLIGAARPGVVVPSDPATPGPKGPRRDARPPGVSAGGGSCWERHGPPGPAPSRTATFLPT